MTLSFLLIFLDEVVERVRVHPDKGDVAELGLQVLHEVIVDRIVHHQHFVSPILRCFDEAVVLLDIMRVEHNYPVVLVGLCCLHFFLEFFHRTESAVRVFQQHELYCFFVEFFITQHSILDEHTEVSPLFFEAFPVFLEQVMEFVGYFFGDVARDLADIAIAL